MVFLAMLTAREEEVVRRFMTMLETWNSNIDKAAALKGIQRQAAALQATIQACSTFDELKALDLGQPGYSVSISQLSDALEREDANQMTLNEFRALAIGIFYGSNSRSPIFGEKDTPLQHAMMLTASLESEVRRGRELTDIDELGRQEETIDRTQRRFKKSLAGKQVLSIDWERQAVTVVDAAEAYFSERPAGPGRPRKDKHK